MRILVLGSGGREHALTWGLDQSGDHLLWAAPGNPGIAELAQIEEVVPTDPDLVVRLADEIGVDLVVVGPEAPLVAGVADRLRKAGVPCFGPGSDGAALEGSKWFAKEVMAQAGVRCADGRVFEDLESAGSHMGDRPEDFVIKADGLAAGKGVFLPESPSEAREILGRLFDGGLGDAGKRVVVERRLQGPEVSVLAVCSGRQAVVFPPSRDHKRVGEGDTGPNTGGMGAVSPPPELPEGFSETVREEIVLPVLNVLADRGIDYRGVLYAGLMLTDEGPAVLEFNVRFGDPETQVVLPRIDCDLGGLLLAAARGEKLTENLTVRPEPAACVIMASGGYPSSYRKGFEIHGLDQLGDAIVFHAGTARRNGAVVTAGGRVLGVTALGDDYQSAIDRAYRAAGRISFQNAYFRRDIGRSSWVSSR